MSEQPPAAPPQHSPDGKYWWNGNAWMPVDQPAIPAKKRGRGPLIALGLVIAAIVGMGVCVSSNGSTHVDPQLQAAADQYRPLRAEHDRAIGQVRAQLQTIQSDDAKVKTSLDTLMHAEHQYAQGLLQIPFPVSVRADARAAAEASVAFEADCLLVQSSGLDAKAWKAAWDARDAADAKLAKDLKAG